VKLADLWQQAQSTDTSGRCWLDHAPFASLLFRSLKDLPCAGRPLNLVETG
jgi:hypothetical protein